MDYRPVFLVAFFVFGVTLAFILWSSRRDEPRPERTGGKRGTAWIQVDVKFAVIALIFIAFDMEMIYMFPWAVAYLKVGAIAFWDMFVFAIILVAGLVYAWKRGGFEL